MGVKLIGEAPMFVVQSIEVRQARNEFTRATIELICPFNFSIGDVSKIDFSKAFKAPEVTKAIETEIQKQTRKFNFDA